MSRLQRGYQTEEHTGHERETRREAQHPPVEPELGQLHSGRDRAAWQKHRQQPRGPHAERQSGSTAERPEQCVLGEELSQEASAARAQRLPDGDLAMARVGAREQQIRDVRSGDEQNEPDDRHQQQCRL